MTKFYSLTQLVDLLHTSYNGIRMYLDKRAVQFVHLPGHSAKKRFYSADDLIACGLCKKGFDK